MLSINDLKSGLVITIDNEPYQILEVKHLHMGRGGSSIQTRIRNLKTGQVLQRNFKPADAFEEADIEKRKVTFVYAHRGEYVFSEAGKRFSLKENEVGDIRKWLKPNTEIEAVFLDDALLSINVPIKIDFRITESPPGLKGDTAQGGTKIATIETGAKISVPLFINEGDVIRVNTQTGEYAERVEKMKD
ncbi:MAG: elongation factor P [Candidatus Sungbacteria bacterium]|nr:elongation factor P [Candidatus Sungbacteria bacterium]